MALRDILIWPDARLKEPAFPVVDFGEDLQVLLDDMVETMYAADGIGLAGPQIGAALRLFVVDPRNEEGQNDPVFFINPQIMESEGEILFEEGCLSVPGEVIEIARSNRVKLRAQDRNGKAFEMDAEGLLAVALQHECDHIEGILIVDRLSVLKRGLLRKKMKALKAEAAGTESSL